MGVCISSLVTHAWRTGWLWRLGRSDHIVACLARFAFRIHHHSYLVTNILAKEMAFGDLEKLKKDSATKRSSKGFYYTVRKICAYLYYSGSSRRSSRYDSY